MDYMGKAKSIVIAQIAFSVSLFRKSVVLAAVQPRRDTDGVGEGGKVGFIEITARRREKGDDDD